MSDKPDSEVVVSKNATTTPGHTKTLAEIVDEIHGIAVRFHEDYLSDPVEFEGYERIANEFSTLAREIEDAVKRARIIVSAYTGYLMCDFSSMHKYIEEKMGRPVFTHEFVFKSTEEKVRELARPDFLKLCGNAPESLTPRPATEEDIESGKAKWCSVCVSECPDKGKDLLCICEQFREDK